MVRRTALVLTACGVLAAQALPPKNVVGTVMAIRAAGAEIEVKPDGAPAVTARLSPDTLFQRVSPGERDLRNASAIQLSELATGDRVLVTWVAGVETAKRVLVMPAAEIARRDEADREDWNFRGVSGVVVAKDEKQIVLSKRSFLVDVKTTVNLGDNTTYRRYAANSVKFADAKPSGLAEIQPGDQLRARGTKSQDGLSVDAEQVVFGTFVTKAGTLASVDPAADEVTIKELGTGLPLVIRFTADSHIKQMPNFGGMPPSPMPGGGTGMPGPLAGGPPDFSQMLEQMPSVKLEDLKPGTSVVVSSTKGTASDRLTAIILLTNADMLIQMASAQASHGQANGVNGSRGTAPGVAGASGAMSGIGNLELPGMTIP